MKKIIFLLLILAACSAPQLEPEKPTLPSSENRIITTQTNPDSPIKQSTAKDKLDALFMKQPPTEYQLTIEIHAHMNDTPHTETITQYVQEENFKTQSVQLINNKEVIFETYFVNNEFTLCMKNSTWTCETVPGQEPPEQPLEEASEFEEPVITQLPGRTIAELSTQCFELKYQGSEEELCVADNGVVAYRKVTFGEEEIVEKLTAFQQSIPLNAFKFPEVVS